MLLQDNIHSFLLAQKENEGNINLNLRKKKGIFFTHNLDTIDKILSVIDFSIIESKKILEPACGEGIFILRILSKLYEQKPDKKIISDFICNNIVFNDFDASMIEKTKKNINELYFYWFHESYQGLFQGFVSDFTVRNNKKKATLFEETKEIVLEKYYGNIDYIVGNPPYISLYGRRDKKQNEQQRIDYLKNYNQFPSHVQNGKINIVMLFLEHSLDFLKNNGKLSFILDVAFFETAYQYTRQFLLENVSIEKLITNINDFDVASGQIILQFSKDNNNAKNIVQVEDKKANNQYTVLQSLWKNPKDEFKFRFNGDSLSQTILEKIKNKNDSTVLDCYPNKNLRTCTMLLDMEDKFTSTKADLSIDLNNELVFPYYQGSKSLSQKYGKFQHEKYFIYDKPLQDKINNQLKLELEKQGIKNKKRIGLGEIVVYNNPKIFIRQSAKELIASVDYGKSAANNSLYVFSLRNNSKETIFILHFLCAWFNSDIMTFYAQKQNIIRFAQGKQPQIKISDLGTIPFPTDKKLQSELALLSSKFFNFQDSNASEYKEKINEIVFEYYDIKGDEITFIQKNIKDF